MVAKRPPPLASTRPQPVLSQRTQCSPRRVMEFTTRPDDIPCREEAKRHGDHGSGRRAEKRDRQGLPQRAEIARRRARFGQEFAVAQFSASLTSASIRSRIAQRLEL